MNSETHTSEDHIPLVPDDGRHSPDGHSADSTDVASSTNKPRKKDEGAQVKENKSLDAGEAVLLDKVQEKVLVTKVSCKESSEKNITGNHQSPLVEENTKPEPQSSDNQDHMDEKNQHLLSSNSKEKHQFSDAEEEEPLDLGNLAELDGSGRNQLFERGQLFDHKGKQAEALHCYLGCLTGLTDAGGFTDLPRCLHRIADIYYEREEFEKAVQFIQAEKLFYETAIVDSETLKRKLVEKLSESEYSEEATEQQQNMPEAQRAVEYENLAQMCLQKNQVQLALEYQGKATKLRQQVFGEEHGITLRSLDLFTAIYGEMGKQQYSESMAMLGDTIDLEAGKTEDNPQSILRRRKNQNPDEKDKDSSQRVRFDQKDEKESINLSEEDKKEMEEYEHEISKVILGILFVIVGLVLSILLLYLYCHLGRNRHWCTTWKNELYYYYMRVKYFYYTYGGTPQTRYG